MISLKKMGANYQVDRSEGGGKVFISLSVFQKYELTWFRVFLNNVEKKFIRYIWCALYILKMGWKYL